MKRISFLPFPLNIHSLPSSCLFCYTNNFRRLEPLSILLLAFPRALLNFLHSPYSTSLTLHPIVYTLYCIPNNASPLYTTNTPVPPLPMTALAFPSKSSRDRCRASSSRPSRTRRPRRWTKKNSSEYLGIVGNVRVHGITFLYVYRRLLAEEHIFGTCLSRQQRTHRPVGPSSKSVKLFPCADFCLQAIDF